MLIPNCLLLGILMAFYDYFMATVAAWPHNGCPGNPLAVPNHFPSPLVPLDPRPLKQGLDLGFTSVQSLDFPGNAPKLLELSLRLCGCPAFHDATEKYVNIPSEKYIYVHIYVCICVYTYLCKMDEYWSYAGWS